MSFAFQWLAEMAKALVQPALQTQKHKTTPVSLVQFRLPWSWQLLQPLDAALDELYNCLLQQAVAPMRVQVRENKPCCACYASANGAAKRACANITL